MSFSNSSEPSVPLPSRPPPPLPDTASIYTDHQISPALSSASPSFPDSSTVDAGYLAPHEHRDESIASKTDTSSSKIKKKFSELDIRGAMADLDIRKGGKRTGIEDFYIQLDEPHRMFWCPGETVKGRSPVSHVNCQGKSISFSIDLSKRSLSYYDLWDCFLCRW